MKARAFLVIPLLAVAASVALLVLAFYSPVKVLPTLNLEIEAGIANPWIAMQRAQMAYKIAMSQYALYQRELLTAGGFGVFAVLMFMWEASLHGPIFLRKPLKASILMLSLVLGAFCLSFMLWASDIGWWWFPLVGFFTASPNFVVSMTVGYAAVVFFACATVGFTISARELQGGWLRPFWNVVRFFGVPMVLVLELGLLSRYPSWAPFYVVTSFTWAYNGAYILSNENLLLAASALAILGYVVQPLLSHVILPLLKKRTLGLAKREA